MKHDMKHISIYRDGRARKYRVRISRHFDSAFSRLELAVRVRDVEVRGAYRHG